MERIAGPALRDETVFFGLNGPLTLGPLPSWTFFEVAQSAILRRPVGVEIRRGNLMAELTLGQGFEAVGAAEASLARRGASLTSHFL